MSVVTSDVGSLLRAVSFAAIAHSFQRRKDSAGTPYINHPIHVAETLAQCGITDVSILSAAVLHDTVEDTGVTYDQLVTEFGKEIADYVSEVSDDKSLSKVRRKELQIIHAAHVSPGARCIKLADKYSNISQLHADPPVGWSQSMINGYIVWGYYVVQAARGVNPNLDGLLDQTFEKLNISKDEQERQKQLHDYYALLTLPK